MALEWGEPGFAGRVRDDWMAVAVQLREHPKRWAVIAEKKASTAYNFAFRVKAGEITAFRPRGAFEAVARKRPDGSAQVFARYVGEPYD